MNRFQDFAYVMPVPVGVEPHSTSSLHRDEVLFLLQGLPSPLFLPGLSWGTPCARMGAVVLWFGLAPRRRRRVGGLLPGPRRVTRVETGCSTSR